jgi:hypothetical protein
MRTHVWQMAAIPRQCVGSTNAWGLPSTQSIMGMCISHYSYAYDTAWRLPSTQMRTHVWQNGSLSQTMHGVYHARKVLWECVSVITRMPRHCVEITIHADESTRMTEWRPFPDNAWSLPSTPSIKGLCISHYTYASDPAWRLSATQMRAHVWQNGSHSQKKHGVYHPRKALWECVLAITRMPPPLRGDYHPRR